MSILTKRTKNNGQEETVNVISADDRAQLTSSLKKSFPADKRLLNCMEHLGETFVQQFAMNSHLLSCVNEQKSNDETQSDNLDGEEAQPQQEFVDGNGIHCLLSVMVVGRVSKKKNKKGG